MTKESFPVPACWEIPGECSGVNKLETLKARARILAKDTGHAKESGENLEVVEFYLSHERYALELTHIREVYPLHEITPIPGTPSFVTGIVSTRGQIVSVIDIKQFFDLPDKGKTDLRHVIILSSEEMEFGILADEINGVKFVPTGDIQPSLPTFEDIRARYLKGVTNDRLMLLDAEKILSDKKIVVNEEV